MRIRNLGRLGGLTLILLPCTLWAGNQDAVKKEIGRYEKEAVQCLFDSDFAQAERWWAKSVELCERPGADPLDLANVLNSLGATQILSGKLREAEVTLERSLKIRREKLGDKEEETITTIGNLSTVFIDLAKHKEAEALLHICHQYMQSGSKGAPTPNKLLSSLGRLYLTAERYNDAEWCFLNAIEIGRRKKEDNSELGWSYRFLAEVYLARGESAQAKRALDISVNLYPFLKNQQVGRHYAHAYLLEGKLELADKSLADHLQKLKSNKNPDALELAKDFELLARVKVERKQFAEAAALYQESLKLRESVLGGDHPLVAAVLEQQCRYLPTPPEGAAERARAIRKRAEAHKPLGLARRQAAGELLFEGTTEVPKD